MCRSRWQRARSAGSWCRPRASRRAAARASPDSISGPAASAKPQPRLAACLHQLRWSTEKSRAPARRRAIRRARRVTSGLAPRSSSTGPARPGRRRWRAAASLSSRAATSRSALKLAADFSPTVVPASSEKLAPVSEVFAARARRRLQRRCRRSAPRRQVRGQGDELRQPVAQAGQRDAVEPGLGETSVGRTAVHRCAAVDAAWPRARSLEVEAAESANSSGPIGQLRRPGSGDAIECAQRRSSRVTRPASSSSMRAPAGAHGVPRRARSSARRRGLGR